MSKHRESHPQCVQHPSKRNLGESSFFFSCVAGLVRDMVGQQLELVEIENKFPRKKETNKEQNQTNTKNTHTHTSQEPGQAVSQANLQTK